MLRLGAQGLSVADIVRRTGLPRGTVRTWLDGGTPRRLPPPLFDPAGVPAAACTYLLGVYLGDGCISAHRRGVYRLRIFLDAAYPGIIAETERAMTAVIPESKVGRLGKRSRYTASPQLTTIELSSYSKRWPCVFPQHGAGMKHQRPIVLAGWQRELIAGDPRPLLKGLIHSDGCRFINTGRGGWRHPRYSFSNVSADIRGIFCMACDLLDLHYTHAPRTVYVSRKADVARMDEFIGPKS